MRTDQWTHLGPNGTTVLSLKKGDGTVENIHLGAGLMRTLIELIDGLATDAGTILGAPVDPMLLPQLIEVVDSMRSYYPHPSD